jgi:diadenosine tetraphosphatase ApaH/serine/threonine PP2A family protein phosphatase
MRTAILTDIHANREAAEAVFAAVRRLAPDRLMILGDVVGYGPDPVFAVEAVARLVADGAVCLMGNHDEAVVTGGGGMVRAAEEAIRWTRGRLSPDHLAFLAGLPAAADAQGILFVHASAHQPKTWDYVIDVEDARRCLAATDAPMVLCGHTHIPALFHAPPGQRPIHFRPIDDKPAPLSAHHRHVAVVGAVGQPRDGNPAACFGLLDTAATTLTMLRVPYDHALTARKVLDAGHPERLATRLALGR